MVGARDAKCLDAQKVPVERLEEVQDFVLHTGEAVDVRSKAATRQQSARDYVAVMVGDTNV